MATGTGEVGTHCTSCGALVMPMFNMNDCKSQCREPAPQPWPFWSTYAPGPPEFMSKSVNGQSSTAEARAQVADAVIAFKPGKEYYWEEGYVPEEVDCLRNSTWNSAVGRRFKLSVRQRDCLRAVTEPAPDWMKQQYGHAQMVCLVRPKS